MQKTPVSILQEMMVKKNRVPKYQLIYDGGGSHENTFTYSVTCESLVANGTGRCKKTAKHIAAKQMLELMADKNGFLALPPTPAQSPVRAPKPPQSVPYIVDPFQPFINAIGALQDLCSENELNDPVYDVISDIGPPHARVFTLQCTVSGFKEEGIATTKKQAKHDAARKMYERIREVLSDIDASKTSSQDFDYLDDNKEEINSLSDNLEETDSLIDEIEDDVEITNEKIIQLFLKLTKNKIIKRPNLGVTLSEYHKKIIFHYDIELRKKVYDELDEIKNIIVNKDYNGIGEFCNKYFKKIGKILEQLEVEMEVSFISGGDDKFLACLHVNVVPTIIEIDAANNLFNAVTSVCIRTIIALQNLLL